MVTIVIENKFRFVGMNMKEKLGNLYKISSGGTPSKSINEYYEGGNIRWVKTGDLKQEYLHDTEDCITEVGLNKSSARMYEENTVLIAMYGATIGATSILKIPACTNQACAAFPPIDNIIPEYLYYFFKSKKSQFVKDGVGGAQPNISGSYLKEVELDLIDLKEQKKIVNILDNVVKIILSRNQQMQQMNSLIKSRFVEMFGDPNNEYSKWDKIPLGDLCTIVRGGSPRPIEKFLGGNIPWIKIGDATQGDNIYLHSTKEHIIEEGIKKSRYIKKGSMIFANCGVSLGFARIITFDGCIHDGWLAFQDIDERLNNVFLLKALNMCTDYFRKTAPDGTQPNLNTGIMKNYLQIVPPIEIQKEFVLFCEHIDKLKVEVQKSLNETQMLFDSLIQKYFK
jgi:restriction endonuclease S subunit